MKLTISQLVSTVVVLIAFIRYAWQRRPFVIRGGVALITGASSGIGEALAVELATKGCSVVLTARTEASLRAVAAKCSAAGASGTYVFPADLTNTAQRVALADFVKTTVLGCGAQKLALLVLNAGRGAITPFDESPATLKICEEMMNINYFPNVHLLQLFKPLLATQSSSSNGSTVLVVSSLAGVLPTPLRTAYCASKHALQGFCNALRAEWETDGIKMCLCCPGFVLTGFHDRVLSSTGDAPERHAQSFMTPDECARQCITAVERGSTELIMTWMGWIGHKLRPCIPRVVDAVAKRKALATLKGSGK